MGLAKYLPRQAYPDPQAQISNHLHQVDLVGPIYLKGRKQRYYIFVCKDVFDGAVCLKLTRSRKMDDMLTFLGRCWKSLGRPAQVQFDNAREIVGWRRAARYLSRVIRLCLRFDVEPIFIPPGQPQYNGSVENFNGWFQPLLFQRRFARPADLKRELKRLQDTFNAQHVQQRLGGLTPAQYCNRQKLQLLPHSFTVSPQLAYRRGLGDLHSHGFSQRQHPPAGIDLQSWQALERSIRQSCLGYATGLADCIPERARVQTLALQILG
jgi:hypothetical protein